MKFTFCRGRRIFRVCCAGGAIWSGAAMLSAQTIVQRVDFTSADFNPAAATATTAIGHTFGFSFNRFDASLGLLDSVTVNYSFSFGGTVFTGPNASSGSFTMGGPLSLDGTTLTGSGAGGGNGGPPNATQSISGGIAGDLGTTGGNYITGASVTGTGQATLAWTMTGSVSASNGSSTDLELSSGSFEVIYNYTPSAIPEPGTWAAIAGGAALACAGVRRRRRKYAAPGVAGS